MQRARPEVLMSRKIPTSAAAAVKPSARSLYALDALNIFLADIAGGIGPFLAVYLAASLHWNSSMIGSAMFASGLAGVIAQIPGGALIDGIWWKRYLISGAAGAVALCCLLMVWFPRFWVIVGAQSLIGVAGAVFGPSVAAISLGLVGRHAMDIRAGRNQSLSSVGNLILAAVAGAIGYFVSRDAIFYFVAIASIATIISALLINECDIDHSVARGQDDKKEPQCTGEDDQPDKGQVVGVGALLADRRVLIFAACAIAFHFANAAPGALVAQLFTKGTNPHPTLFTSASIILAQLVIIPLGYFIGKNAATSNRKPLYLIAFMVLPLRCFLLAVSHNHYWLTGLSVLDGVAGGVFGVMQLLVIKDLTRGTGRFNITQGALGTAVGIGASLSQLLAGFVVKQAGFNAAFLTMGAIASAACALFFFAMPETKENDNSMPSAVEATPQLVPESAPA